MRPSGARAMEVGSSSPPTNRESSKSGGSTTCWPCCAKESGSFSSVHPQSDRSRLTWSDRMAKRMGPPGSASSAQGVAHLPGLLTPPRRPCPVVEASLGVLPSTEHPHSPQPGVANDCSDTGVRAGWHGCCLLGRIVSPAQVLRFPRRKCKHWGGYGEGEGFTVRRGGAGCSNLGRRCRRWPTDGVAPRVARELPHVRVPAE